MGYSLIGMSHLTVHPGLVLKCSSRISQLVDAKPEMKAEAKIAESQDTRGNLENHSWWCSFLKTEKALPPPNHHDLQSKWNGRRVPCRKKQGLCNRRNRQVPCGIAASSKVRTLILNKCYKHQGTSCLKVCQYNNPRQPSCPSPNPSSLHPGFKQQRKFKPPSVQKHL